MKIAIITRYFLPVEGGIENHCFNLARKLIEKGVYVEVHTSKDTFTKKNILSDFEVISSVKVFRYKNFWKFIPKNCDIAHLHNFNIFPHFWIFLMTFIRRLFKVRTSKLIVTLHGSFTPWWEEFSIPVRVIKRVYHKTIGKFFLNHVADRIISLNEWEKEQLVKEGIIKEKIVIVPNGVDELAYILPNRRGKYAKYKPYLLFIGRINKVKNIDLAVRYLKRLNGVNLIIVGPLQDRKYYQYLKKLVSDLGLVGKIFFFGEIHNKEKYELIDNALALVLLSYNEAEPIVIKEAMVRGKPVIVSNIAVFKHLIENGKNGFIVSNQRDFEKAVKLLLTNNALRSQISKFNKKKATSWRWQFIAEITIKVYREVMKQ